MNDNRMKRWMDAIDDDLLEEAQRPLPRGGAARRWGALAACFCAAALALALWQPWSAGIGDNTAGADADFGAMDKSFSVAMPPVLDAEPLSASLALPEGASLTSDYQWRQDGEGAVTGVSIVDNAETAGIGSKGMANDALPSGVGVLDQFQGKSAADGTLTVGSNVVAITGATVSTKGVTAGVNAALAAVAAMG